jgi:glutathionylspermidine synthase
MTASHSSDDMIASHSSEADARLADALLDEGTLTDPWLDGALRFSATPCVLSADKARALERAAEAMAFAFADVRRVIADDESLLGSFLGLGPAQQAMWRASGGLWHGIARIDLFLTAEGPVAAEINCDTPTGQAESVLLGALAAAPAGTHCPNRRLGERFVRMVATLERRLLTPEARARRTAAIVYPTELTEDLPLVRLYRRWLGDAGHRVLLGSPFNLGADASGNLTIFGEPVSLMVRHYKTDWWGERESAWNDEAIVDHEPLAGPLAAALDAAIGGRCAIVNPFGAVVMQNKRTMALMFERSDRFDARAQEAIARYLPPTFRAEILEPSRLLAERDEWVLKSDYGAEGEEVVIGREVGEEAWRRAVLLCRRGRWVAQRRFSPLVGDGGGLENHGVWLVAGQAVGHYTRRSKGPTDAAALSVPTWVEAPAARADASDASSAR